ncbi:hypothetical protein Isop_1855 [Isosphaera pallida ATCC 43644]|uniref:Uncharacterized protein n=1 Tax=Isosphaera pallida (strain ATCC 43644 / DSM 9630 / IS1B) TaxID=575540 RepID=E8R204_ISOPI|nr:hypothetical protein [Isosphaera pallida]ADV62436.1 hypothetical protein Isop_1855 [Isosphaera pallida ATCC 43644]
MTMSANEVGHEIYPPACPSGIDQGEASARATVDPSERGSSSLKRWAARAGVAGFGFFLIKGLVWLAFFAAVATGLASR